MKRKAPLRYLNETRWNLLQAIENINLFLTKPMLRLGPPLKWRSCQKPCLLLVFRPVDRKGYSAGKIKGGRAILIYAAATSLRNAPIARRNSSVRPATSTDVC
jgi:hypothetical protein